MSSQGCLRTSDSVMHTLVSGEILVVWINFKRIAAAEVVATVGDGNRCRPVQLFGPSSPRYTVAASRVQQKYAHSELHKSYGGSCNANYVRTAQSCWHLT